MFCENPAATENTTNNTIDAWKMALRPKMSDSLPRIGVAIVCVSR